MSATRKISAPPVGHPIAVNALPAEPTQIGSVFSNGVCAHARCSPNASPEPTSAAQSGSVYSNDVPAWFGTANGNPEAR
jgi:hypothetical protein